MKPKCPLTASHKRAEGTRVPPPGDKGSWKGAVVQATCPGEIWMA